MGICPKCSHEMDHDFGVIVCEKCDSVLFVDFDGNLQASNPGESAAESSAPLVEEQAESLEAFEPDIEGQANSENEVSPEIENLSAEELDLKAETDEAAEGDGTEKEDWFDKPMDNTNETAPAPAKIDSEVVDFKDLEEFANQAELDNSPLVYSLTINKIDHTDTRQKLIEILSEAKLNFHMKDIFPLIKGGSLTLKDLSPIRTYIIVSRLREQSLEFKWKQSVFQSEPKTEPEA